ncbi:TlpA family protein disulfide reductase [Mesoterricola silvestris]|uniref:Thiol reductase thioredoxin n=1 Tax=Mesoterricola silvestris TaxID=2927979 RepID=A0AA48GWA0_9BACT|nr:thioredoxin family protein [Mesoterricola silvestris]BDU71503.1 thiol reductase thioredoxin [Mesoterricola silvestris]
MSLSRLSAMMLAASVVLSADVPALDPAGLTQLLKAGTWTVVEFGGPTCIPCRKMQPILAELQQQYGKRAQVRNFYVTEHLKEARELKIMAMPTQVIFDPSGREVGRHIGYWEKAEFQAALVQVGLK